jgi:group II intron reverse transcriptase/maturase
MMNLAPPNTVRKLQAALHVKAKEAPSYRFYSLYDKVFRRDVLEYAYLRLRQNAGVPGADGETFAAIEAKGRTEWLDVLAKELREGTYQPGPIRRVFIPKPDGKQRPLGIGTIRDRVVQMAVVLVLEPIFEADLQPEQYAYRPGKSAHDALRRVHELVNTGYRHIVDADLSGYFDSIPHPELLKSVARRVSDGRLLALIKAWLEAPVEERNGRGNVSRTTRNRDERQGTPQGSPLSPLLANIYFRRFILGWKRSGYAQRFDAHIVNYADDFVICCRSNADKALAATQELMSKLKLTVNETKTRVCKVPAEPFDFLGYTIGLCYRPRGGSPYLGNRPSAKRIARIKREISELTGSRRVLVPVEMQVGRLNRLLTGWSSYFSLGAVTAAYRALDYHVRDRLRQWLCRKHKVYTSGALRFTDQYLYDELGLVKLCAKTKRLPWANT